MKELQPFPNVFTFAGYSGTAAHIENTNTRNPNPAIPASFQRQLLLFLVRQITGF